MSDYNNKMSGKGNLIATATLDLECEVNPSLIDKSIIDAELIFKPQFKNKVTGQIEILKMEYPKYRVYSDNDTYVKESIPFFSYYEMASLPNGNQSGENYQSFVSFYGLTNIDSKITKRIGSAKLILYKNENSPKDVKIELFELDNKFVESNMSYFTHPELKTKIADNVYNSVTKTYEFDITKYVKEVTDSKVKHNGFGFKSDKAFISYSSNSVYKPQIVIEYIPENLFGSTSRMDAEMKLLKCDVIDCELEFDDEYPRIDCECIVSRDDILAESNIEFVDVIDAEIRFRFPDFYSLIEAECLFSKGEVDSEVELATVVDIEAECTFKRAENANLDCEILLYKLDHRPAYCIMALNTLLDAEVDIIPTDTNDIPCELEFTNPSIESEVDVIPMYDSNLEAEVQLIKIDEEFNMDAEAIFSKDFINAGMMVRFVSNLEANVEFVFEKIIDAECVFNKADESYNEAEVDILLKESIDSEVNLLVSGDPTELESEVNLLSDDISNIDSEVGIRFVAKTDIISETEFLMRSDLECQVFRVEGDKSQIPAEVVVRFNTDVKIDSEVNLLVSGEPINIDAEAIFRARTEQSIDSEVNLLNDWYSNIPSEVGIRFMDGSMVECESQLLLVENFEAEVIMVRSDSSKIDAEVGIRFIDNDIKEAEVNLLLPGDLIELDAEVNLLSDDKSELDAEVGVVVTNIISSIDAEVDIRFIGGSTILGEVNLLLPGDLTELECELIFRKDEQLDLEAETIFLKQVEDNIDVEVNLYKDGSDPMECECIFLDQKELEIDSEVNLLVNMKSEIDIDVNLLKLAEPINIDAEVDVLLVNKCPNIIIIEN